jgi:hypothetical protein
VFKYPGNNDILLAVDLEVIRKGPTTKQEKQVPPFTGWDAAGGQTMSELNRRDVLGAAAATTVGLLAAAGRAQAAGDESQDELPTFRYPMEQQKGKVTESGSATGDCGNCTGTPTPLNGPS